MHIQRPFTIFFFHGIHIWRPVVEITRYENTRCILKSFQAKYIIGPNDKIPGAVVVSAAINTVRRYWLAVHLVAIFIIPLTKRIGELPSVADLPHEQFIITPVIEGT